MPQILDCACVIHGNVYEWAYVERLYNMLTRHISAQVRFHVYTEATRPVPAPWIKHNLIEWGIGGAKLAWWYKMQMFNSVHHSGPLLYFDLDTVIVNNIDWIHNLPLSYFWGVRDFKYLWRPNYYVLNSSIMWWDTRTFDHTWKSFEKEDLKTITKKYRGDQDYINQAVGDKNLRFFDSNQVKSWRWECLDGGNNFKRRRPLTGDTNTVIPENTSVLVFHGQPKPNNLQDPVILQHWQ